MNKCVFFLIYLVKHVWKYSKLSVVFHFVPYLENKLRKLTIFWDILLDRALVINYKQCIFNVIFIMPFLRICIYISFKKKYRLPVEYCHFNIYCCFFFN